MDLLFGILIAVFAQLFEPITPTSLSMAPYMSPMLLGRSFDVSKSEVGVDLFTSANRKKSKSIKNVMTTIKFKMIKDSSDVNEVLDISGELSLQIKAGLVDIEGSGKYLKEQKDTSNFVEVMAKIQTVTETITLTSDIPNENILPDKVIGKHYVRSITYGGFLLASLRFEAKRGSSKEDIEAKVRGNVKAATFEVGLSGQFKKVANSAEDVSDLTIKYYATAPLETSPTDVDSLSKAIKEFPDQLIKNKPVPLYVNLQEISSLDPTKADLLYSDNRLLRSTVNEVDMLYTDLLKTDEAVKYWVKNSMELNDEQLQMVQNFYSNLSGVIGAFDKTIASIDLNCKEKTKCNNDNFQAAFDKYRGDGYIIPGKYQRMFDRLRWKIEMNDELEQEIQSELQDTDEIDGEIKDFLTDFKQTIPDENKFIKQMQATIGKLDKILPGYYMRLVPEEQEEEIFGTQSISFTNPDKTYEDSVSTIKLMMSGLYLISYSFRVYADKEGTRYPLKISLERKPADSSDWEVISYSVVTFPESCPSCDQILSDTLVYKLGNSDKLKVKTIGTDARLLPHKDNFFSFIVLRDTDPVPEPEPEDEDDYKEE